MVFLGGVRDFAQIKGDEGNVDMRNTPVRFKGLAMLTLMDWMKWTTKFYHSLMIDEDLKEAQWEGNTLCNRRLSESAETIEEVYEPFLTATQQGFIVRTPRGREVTD